MSMYALLRSNKTLPTEEEIEENLAGNLCRCTGYRPIVDAFRIFAKTNDSIYTKHSTSSASSHNFICPSSGQPCDCGAEKSTYKGSVEPVSCSDMNGTLYSEKELIFPPELALRKNIPLKLSGSGGLLWFRPIKLKHVLNLKSQYPHSKLIVGNTEVGIEMKFKNAPYNVFVSVSHVLELNVLNATEKGLEIGASVRLTDLHNFLKKMVLERNYEETSSCVALIEQLKWFAGKQIRNVASVGGNICTASPISDLNPLWMASGAIFNVIDSKGNIRTTNAKDFFLSYRKIDLSPSEILLSITVPWTRPFEFVKEFKQAHRRDDDIALVNAGMRVFVRRNFEKWEVVEASIVYGGVAPVTFRAVQTELLLVGKIWDEKLLGDALSSLKEEISLHENAPGGMIEFRKSLTLSFFFKFFLWVYSALNNSKENGDLQQARQRSAIQSLERPPSTGSQSYELVSHGTAVGHPNVHLSAGLQVFFNPRIDSISLPIFYDYISHY